MSPAFEPSPQHLHLAALVGEWEGPTMTWLNPDDFPETSVWKGRVEPVLDGRFVRFVYTGTAGGKPHAGELLLGFETSEGRWNGVWIDTFHTGTALMALDGGNGDLPDVHGTYAAGEQRWGWRIRVSQESPDELAFEHWNISPKEDANRAITTRLKRVKK